MSGDLVGAVCLLGVAYCFGGIHGLWLGWTHQARMNRWAVKASALHVLIAEAYERGASPGEPGRGAPARAEPEDVPRSGVPVTATASGDSWG